MLRSWPGLGIRYALQPVHLGTALLVGAEIKTHKGAICFHRVMEKVKQQVTGTAKSKAQVWWLLVLCPAFFSSRKMAAKMLQ